MSQSDNLAALLSLRNQLSGWRNIALFMAFVALLLAAAMLLGGPSTDSGEGVKSAAALDYIARVKIDGVIKNDSYREELLNKIAKKNNVKALLVEIDSPGGTVSGSESLYNSMRAIAKHKPVVAVVSGTAASGAYMTAIGADYIIARNSSIIGSIGVIMQSAEFTELAKHIGINFLTYKSSPLKAAPSPFEKTTPEIDIAVRELIADVHSMFVDMVGTRRKINEAQLLAVTDGRVFTGRTALKLGLIDKIGDDTTAIDFLAERYKIKSLSVYDISLIKDESRLSTRLFSSISSIISGGNVARQAVAYLPKTGLLAVWQPGITIGQD